MVTSVIPAGGSPLQGPPAYVPLGPGRKGTEPWNPSRCTACSKKP